MRPRFSFGMIVFNGETFLREVLESIYDFAYEIIVVEGPDENALFMAGPDGGSTDGTMEILTAFPDPHRKLRVIRGQWTNKDEQSNRYISEARGDFIWQVDDDEVYHPDDLRRIEEILVADPDITAVSFHWQNFFKSFDRVMVADPPYEVWRLFRLRPGYRFRTHRPPTVIDPKTGEEMNRIKPMRGAELAAMGIFIYHYSYVYRRQVEEKIRYHANYRLNERGLGIPPLPAIGARFGWASLLWRKLWSFSPLRPLRERRDPDFNYRYLETVWDAWNVDPKGVEERLGVSPSTGPFRRTAPFRGTHPPAIQRRIAQEHLR